MTLVSQIGLGAERGWGFVRPGKVGKSEDFLLGVVENADINGGNTRESRVS